MKAKQHRSSSGRGKKRSGRRARKVHAITEPHWTDLSPKVLQQPGGGLMMLIVEEVKQRALGQRQAAKEHLGITLQYYNKLRNGSALVSNLGSDILTRIADFLRVPKIVVMILAGQISTDDFVAPASNLDDQVLSALQALVKDRKYELFTTPQIFTLPMKIKVLMAKLYEDASGLKFIQDAIEPVPLFAQAAEVKARASQLLADMTPSPPLSQSTASDTSP